MSSGCSISTYDLDFGTQAGFGEVEIETKGVRFYIGKKYISIVKGTEISYDEKKEGFFFNNPNMKE